LRIDPTDGNAYPQQCYTAHYGQTDGPLAWARAIVIPPALWNFYHLPRNAIFMTNLQNAPQLQCRQQKKSKSETYGRQVVTSSFRNPGSPLIFFAPPNLWDACTR
jgi:hypothetical protein